MKTNLTETKFKFIIGSTRHLISRVACLGAVMLICSSASAQNVFVSGRDAHGGEIYKFTWDGAQSIFASGFIRPLDVAFDSAGNLFVVDYNPLERVGPAAIFKITPNGTQTIFAWGVSYPSYLAVDNSGNVFLADYEQGVIYRYKPNGSRATFASGLYHPVGMACDRSGNLFVADNSIGDLSRGSIYKYKPDGSRSTFAVLDESDRPADLALDSLGNLYMADLGGNIYKYNVGGVLRRYARFTFAAVPGSAQSLGFDGAGNLLVIDGGSLSATGTGAPNAIYKFTQQGVRSTFASAKSRGESFACLAVQPVVLP